MRKLLQIIRDWPWEYGTVTTPHSVRRSRRHRVNGEVQFVLWKSGEQSHEEDFWCAYNPYWWPYFTPKGGQS